MSRLRLALFLSLVACTACNSSHGHSYYRMSSDTALIERQDGSPNYVAYYRDGELVGAAAISDPGFPFYDWARDQPGEYVDHPNIPRWRTQLEQLRILAAVPDTSPATLVSCAHGFPFDRATAESFEVWMGERPERAAALLDGVGAYSIRDEFAELLATMVLRSDVDDARIATWVRGLTDEDHDEAVVVLVGHSGAGELTAYAALAELDEYSSDHRGGIFAAAAGRLASEPDAAVRILDAADDLRSADEAAALQQLLDADASPELARQVVRHLDDRRSADRGALFARAAALTYRDDRYHRDIANGLGELPSRHRLDGARTLVERPDAPAKLMLLLISCVGTLPSSDREALLTAVLDGPHGDNEAVREACRDAARGELRSAAAERVLQRIGR